jgi:hypothetical protein
MNQRYDPVRNKSKIYLSESSAPESKRGDFENASDADEKGKGIQPQIAQITPI